MNDFQIRNVLEEDFTEIAELAENCKPMVTERNSIYHIFTKFFKRTSFVAEIPGKEGIAGFLLGFISQENPEEAYMHLLCIKPELRRSGIAKRMIKKFFNVVENMGCNKVFLITKPENRNAIDFYKNLGFKQDKSGEMIQIGSIGALKDYNGSGKHMVVFYKLINNIS